MPRSENAQHLVGSRLFPPGTGPWGWAPSLSCHPHCSFKAFVDCFFRVAVNRTATWWNNTEILLPQAWGQKPCTQGGSKAMLSLKVLGRRDPSCLFPASAGCYCCWLVAACPSRGLSLECPLLEGRQALDLGTTLHSNCSHLEILNYICKHPVPK